MLEYSNDQCLDNIESCLSVVVRLIRTLDQVITAVKEFGNVTSDIVGEVEFAARMQSLVAIQIEDEIVEDDKFLALRAQ